MHQVFNKKGLTLQLNYEKLTKGKKNEAEEMVAGSISGSAETKEARTGQDYSVSHKVMRVWAGNELSGLTQCRRASVTPVCSFYCRTY